MTKTSATPSITAASRNSPPGTVGAMLCIDRLDRREQRAERKQDRPVARPARARRGKCSEAGPGRSRVAPVEPRREFVERRSHVGAAAADGTSLKQGGRRLAECAGVDLLRQSL